MLKRTNLLHGQLARFTVVGTIGFVTDVGILSVLVHLAHWNPLLGRAVAMAIAIMCTLIMHRLWTFRSGRLRSIVMQSILYGTTQIVSVSVNYGTFSALVLTDGLWLRNPVLAATAGSIMAMAVTYLLSKRVVFSAPRETPNPER
jgi:putative flippase GtrA